MSQKLINAYRAEHDRITDKGNRIYLDGAADGVPCGG